MLFTALSTMKVYLFITLIYYKLQTVHAGWLFEIYNSITEKKSTLKQTNVYNSLTEGLFFTDLGKSKHKDHQ